MNEFNEFTRLSPNHPLRSDPHRPWPWSVLVGYRASRSRKIVDSRLFYIRATSWEQAMAGGMRVAREFGHMTKDGVKLRPSRPISARALDLADRINAGWKMEKIAVEKA